MTCRHSGHQLVAIGLSLCAGPIRAHRFPRVAPRGPQAPFADDGTFHRLYHADGDGEHGARNGTDVATGTTEDRLLPCRITPGTRRLRPIGSTHVNPRIR